MTSEQIRRSFVDYFKKNGHSEVASSSLVPYGDDTLLFTNAGMNQFKNTFLGIEKRDYHRAASVQKCVRAGGKHNDLDNVGFTYRHHTFFQMLGNFSFGDYFKKDAIHFAWELITKEWQLPKDKLFVTVFDTDDEAADIWHKQEGVPRDRIKRMGEADNFWRMGDTGPCGPCSEIFFDHGEKHKDPDTRYVEFWNLVFMQYNEGPVGVLNPLPKPSVDTGAGLERLAAIMQGTHDNYETDELKVLIELGQKITGIEAARDPAIHSAYKVLADHSRAAAFLIGDGVLPSNEGRGYVLRRIMRRALRFGKKIDDSKSIYPQMVSRVIDVMGGFYPELKQNRALIEKTVQGEEDRFFQTLDQGTEILNKNLDKLLRQNKKVLDGESAFRLYDTYGFPIDLTKLMAKEKGFEIDETSFEQKMEEARRLSQASWKGASITADQAHIIQIAQKTKSTEFLGYNSTQGSAQVLLLSDGKNEVTELHAGQTGFMICDKTPFYAESGGQAGDSGTAKSTNTEALILDCTKSGESHLHHIKVKSGVVKKGETLQLLVNEGDRRKTANNHSATHLMHAALRRVLGEHVTQAGSLVEPTRLRFDFTHNAPLKPQEILEIEYLVNREIDNGHAVKTDLMSYNEAIKAGAMALFGEKYGERVRVLSMGDFSVELCGGTHVSNLSQIRLFKIVSETGVSAGVRRIEALTGDSALQYLNKLAAETLTVRNAVGVTENWTVTISRQSSDTPPLLSWSDSAKKEMRELERKLKHAMSSGLDLDKFVSEAKDIQGGKFVSAVVDNDDRDVLSQISDTLKNKIKSGVVVVIGKSNDSYPIIVSVSKDLTSQYPAGKLLQKLATALGGKGGGRPDFAQGAGKDLSGLNEALNSLIQ